MGLTTNKNDECLNEVKDNGQNECYLVLSDEELAKGFVRPLRDSYIHIGSKLHYINIHRMLSEEEMLEHGGKYVAVMTILQNEDGSFKGGPYVTQKQLDAWKNEELSGGCGVLTQMSGKLAQTYAREPHFYGATFCVGCGKHLPVNEFVWAGTDELVGS